MRKVVEFENETSFDIDLLYDFITEMIRCGAYLYKLGIIPDEQKKMGDPCKIHVCHLEHVPSGKISIDFIMHYTKTKIQHDLIFDMSDVLEYSRMMKLNKIYGKH
jgi:hypothetical protein